LRPSWQIANHRDKQIRDARRSHLTKCGKLLAVTTIEQ
jgi:hypothetical protein